MIRGMIALQGRQVETIELQHEEISCDRRKEEERF